MNADALFAFVTVFGSIAFVNILYAVRTIFIVRGRRGVAALIGFLEAALFIVIFGRVASDFSHWEMVLAYCLGAAAGGDLGILLEHSLMTGFVKVEINVTDDGQLLAAYIREKGYGATEHPAQGLSGEHIRVIQIIVSRGRLPALLDFVREKSPEAFITIEDLRSAVHGWLPVKRFSKWNVLANRE